MDFLLGIPYVNHPELLRLALNSVRDLWPQTRIIDHSPDGLTASDWPVSIVRPPVPLSFSQTMNLLVVLADEAAVEIILMMHNDAEAGEGTGARLLTVVRDADRAGRRWGVAFTHYDTLVALSRSMLRTVGLWDTVLPQYFADNDFYRRVRLAGYDLLETGLPVTHHNHASSTIRNDPVRAHLNSVTFPLYEQYYIQKWGGRPGEERFLWPFAGKSAQAFIQGLRQTPLYGRLIASYDTNEGNLLQQADDLTHAAQIETLRSELAWAGSGRILETGTQKCLLGYVLSFLVQDTTLFTFDTDPRSACAAEILQASQNTVRVVFAVGDSKRMLPGFEESKIDLAWIDGGHDGETAFSDISHAMRLGAVSILVDDTKIMPEISPAISRALDEHSEYKCFETPFYQFDSRGLVVLRKQQGLS